MKTGLDLLRGIARYHEWATGAALVPVGLSVLPVGLWQLAPPAWQDNVLASLPLQFAVSGALVLALALLLCRWHWMYWLQRMSSFYDWRRSRYYWATAAQEDPTVLERLRVRAEFCGRKSQELAAIVSVY